MLLDHFKADKEAKSMIVVIYLIYLKVFHLIPPSMDPSIRESWVSFFISFSLFPWGCLGFLYLEFRKIEQEDWSLNS